MVIKDTDIQDKVEIDDAKDFLQLQTENLQNSTDLSKVQTNESPETLSNHSNRLFSSNNNSTHLIFDRMTQPSSSDIRKWMAETQETVDTVITGWQQRLTDISRQVYSLLEEFCEFVSSLDEQSFSDSVQNDDSRSRSKFKKSPQILTAKYPNNFGVYESIITVYLHVICIAIENFKKSMLSEDNIRTRYKHQQFCKHVNGEILKLAENALKFLRTHEKILQPHWSRIVAMRNDFFVFLQPILMNPSCTLIPLVKVSLEELRLEDDSEWLNNQRPYVTYPDIKREYSHMEIKVGARDFKIRNSEEDESVDINQNMELIKLLISQLATCISSSDKQCHASQTHFYNLSSKLTKTYDTFARNLEKENKRSRLKSDSCCTAFKTTLSRLEVKFHQVEKMLEEIPEHMRRVIGVADHCSKQLECELEEYNGTLRDINKNIATGKYTSPIVDISEEIFKRKGKFSPNCFSFFFKSTSGRWSDKKLKEFWETVRTEMEEFWKEVKAKEMTGKYEMTLTVPVSKDSPCLARTYPETGDANREPD